MIRITQLKLRPNESRISLETAIRKALHLGERESFSHEVLRRSIDARKKPELYETYTVLVQVQDRKTERRILNAKRKNVDQYQPARYPFRDGSPLSPVVSGPDAKCLTDPGRPVIIGTGPAGLFCALLLARSGLRPIVIERGQRARARERSVQAFWDSGALNPQSNVQFGEGGAGTFSDGKLNTGVKDPMGRIRFILETFVLAGADPDILYSAHPHVGTDVLKHVVENLTDEIAGRGGEVFFETCMERIHSDGRGLWQISCTNERRGELHFSTRHLVLAIGHSARDTFRMLYDTGIVMRPKAFAAGIRIQHPQRMIDNAMYGEGCRYALPPSPYKLTHRLLQGRGVYSFCMCPGGYVVNASSEEGCLAVNGMSFHDRGSQAANSAIVVTVSPEEIINYMKACPETAFGQDTQARGAGHTETAGSTGHTETAGGTGHTESAGSTGHTGSYSSLQDAEHRIVPDALIGVRFQRMLEQAAYAAGGGAIPVQRFGDFSQKAYAGSLALPDFEPRIKGKWKMAGIRQIFPEDICAAVEEGILSWERQIRGFSSPDALLCAAESRTSSPVRIERGADFQALNHPGLYPCGEGAGYAGGITSAAADGLRIAEQIIKGL